MDLVGNFCSFSESMRIETSLVAIQHFVSCSSHIHCAYVHASRRASARCYARYVATSTILQNFREENFHDQKSNHEIHENIVP